jgi:hypothetical protein
MLKRLRWQLTFVYIVAAIGLVGLVSFGAYSLLRYYFERQTDLALQYKMAAAYRQYGLDLPSELSEAEMDQTAKMWRLFQPARQRQASRCCKMMI